MKRIGFIFCLIIFSSYSFGQQFLWSTEEREDINYVPLERVTIEVMKYYDHYDYYYDGAGYSKDGFLKYFEIFGDDSQGWETTKKRIYDIEDLTVFAFRGNLGRGSTILIMSVSRNDVNYVAFSNYLERDAINADSYDRAKFAKWFNSLLNLTTHTAHNFEDPELQYITVEDPEPEYIPEEIPEPVIIEEPIILNPDIPSIEDIIGSLEDDPVETEEETNVKLEDSRTGDTGEGEFDASGDGIFGRKVIYHPYDELSKVYAQKGRIWIRTCINPMGRVTYVEMDEVNTTVKDCKILRNVLEAARNYRYETDFAAPKEQCGVLRIKVDNFRGER